MTAAGTDIVLRVSETDARKSLVKKIDPEYPAMARQVRMTGTVQLDITIDASGGVEKTQIISGNALLSGSAISAVKKWRFTPFQSEGKACRAITRINFSFKL
ncbi:MAG: energy transducer TonB [Bryobacteraceae bacterium]